MPKFASESLQELRNKIDLADVIGQHINLKRQGAAFKALCPFHDEKTPSFTVQKGDSHYHCFGCGAHGDAISFLMQHVRMTFVDAVQYLAERFQVELIQQEDTFTKNKTSKKELKDVLEAACRFYSYCLLNSAEGEEALQYLFKRGLTYEFIKRFRLGWAPRQEGLLKQLLRSDGYSEEIIEQAGLSTVRGGRSREFFLERITFPILDPMGSVIGFSARKIREETYGGKYINTVETELFKKSKVLFGLSYCRKRIAKERQAIIVEGQLDALRLIFHGFDFTVAGLGTAFGEAHVKELLQLGVNKVYLLLDGDEAGQNAAVKIGHLFQKEGIEVLVVSIPKGSDPDLVLLQEGPIGIVELLAKPQEYLRFLFSYFSKNVRLDSPAEKNQLLQELTRRIREWHNPIMVHESLKKLSHLADVPEELFGVTTKLVAPPQFGKVTHAKSTINHERILEGDLLRWLLVAGGAKPIVFELTSLNIEESDLHDMAMRLLYKEVMSIYATKRTVDLLTLSAHLDTNEFGAILDEIITRKINIEKAEELCAETILKIKERNWLLARDAIRQKIHSGTASEIEVLALVRQFDLLKNQAPLIKRPQKVSS